MSDLVALASTVILALWFVGLSSLLVVNRGGTWVPTIARQMARFSDRSEGRWHRMISDGVVGAFLVLSQVTAVGAIAENWGRASVSVTLILTAEPVLAVAWTVYLARAASSRQV